MRGLEVVGNDYSVLKENDPINRVMFDLTALTTPDSGGVQGDGLWGLKLFGSNNENGVGRRFNEQGSAFSNYQSGKDAFPGEDIDFGMVDTNFNMKGLSCNDVRYLCAELTQGPRPDPPFEFSPVPDPNVLKKCFRQKCDGMNLVFKNPNNINRCLGHQPKHLKMGLVSLDNLGSLPEWVKSAIMFLLSNATYHK